MQIAPVSEVQIRSTARPYDLAVFIGRFQPFHLGHLAVVEHALKNAERVLILVGSANVARDTRNPFTYEERATLIDQIIHDLAVQRVAGGSGDPARVDPTARALRERIQIAPLDDTCYDHPRWINSVNMAARAATRTLRPRVCLTGHMRDATSEYLGWFPAWDYMPAPDTEVNATAIRKMYFDGYVNFHDKSWSDKQTPWHRLCPSPTITFLDNFRDRDTYPYLMKQRAAEMAYHTQWGKGPFQTVDPVIRKGDHVLMIERGGPEGTGAIALPGGFLEPGERLLAGAVREAVEETGLFMPLRYFEHDGEDMDPEWKKQAQAESAKQLKTHQRGRGERFDDPHRSRRGHLITEAFFFDLPPGHGFPPVVGRDDAKRAFWMPISEIRPDNTFEDHAFIVDRMLNLYA
jgi:bifunctional NMN adenylyltransferase/nudix hydrolase